MRPLLLSILSCALMLATQQTVHSGNVSESNQARCADAVPCEVGDRSYHVREPENWDGKSPLPILIHFHGWGRTGLGVIRNKRVWRAADEKGVLLVAPNGRHKSWNFWGSNDRDIQFTLSMLDNIKDRYPVDPDRIWVSGFSYGSAMAWRLACNEGNRFTAFFPIAGAFWNQDSVDCSSGPVDFRHVHGLKDSVMELPSGTGSDPSLGVSLWRRINECGETADRMVQESNDECHVWSRCGSQREVQICLHTGGHWIPKDWIARSIDWANARAGSKDQSGS